MSKQGKVTFAAENMSAMCDALAEHFDKLNKHREEIIKYIKTKSLPKLSKKQAQVAELVMNWNRLYARLNQPALRTDREMVDYYVNLLEKYKQDLDKLVK